MLPEYITTAWDSQCYSLKLKKGKQKKKRKQKKRKKEKALFGDFPKCALIPSICHVPQELLALPAWVFPAPGSNSHAGTEPRGALGSQGGWEVTSPIPSFSPPFWLSFLMGSGIWAFPLCWHWPSSCPRAGPCLSHHLFIPFLCGIRGKGHLKMKLINACKTRGDPGMKGAIEMQFIL